MKRFTTFLVLFAFVFVASAFADHGWHKKYHWWKNENTVKELKVSDSQLNKINKIDEDYKEQFKKLHKELIEVNEQLRSMLNDPKSTNDQLTSKHSEKLTKKRELKTLKFQKKLAIRDTLNDNQIVKLGEIKKENWKKHKKGCSYKDKK